MTAPRFAARPRRAWRAPRLPALALLLGLPACYGWRPVLLAPARDFGRRTEVRVERADGSLVLFKGPRVIGDSLHGVPEAVSAAGRTRTTDTRASGAIALADVRRAHERRLSVMRTTLAVVGVAVVGSFIGLTIDPPEGELAGCRSCSR